MSNLDQNTYRAQTGARAQEIDEGLRSYMLGIYNYMMMALAVTGIAALAITNFGLKDIFFNTVPTQYGPRETLNMVGWIAVIAPLGIVFYLSARMHKMSVGAAQMWFWAFAALIGVSVANLLFNYTEESVARVFFITAASFAGLSLWGYTTKKDLSGWGSFLIMGVIGLVIAMVVNLFLQSEAMHWIVSILGVGIFAGLTAYDTQNLKNIYLGGVDKQGHEVVQRVSIMGALRLYLDFINMFFFLMALLGERE
ncbi:MAG: Bax inhibitor-1/YccA family protein [Alphaproteobacteria bacterium]